MMPRALIGILAAGLGALLAWAMLGLPPPTGRVSALVAAHLNESGVTHDVTAVLLNFRGYDTLLEIGVLLLAVLGVLAVRLAAADTGGPLPPPGALLRALTNLVVPLMVLVAGYLLWAGAHRPGGAFQAGAVLAAAGVLLRLAGRLPALLPPRFWLRAGLLIGFAVFLAVALGMTVAGKPLLEYPVGQAGGLILLIEATLTLSIGLILISLFVGAPAPDGERGKTDA
jgi:multisubunit Na+/H+ antiporter MnhB subunit